MIEEYNRRLLTVKGALSAHKRRQGFCLNAQPSSQSAICVTHKPHSSQGL